MTRRFVLPLAILVMACTGGSGANLSVSAKSAPASSAATTTTTTSPSSAPSLDLGNGISLDRIRIVVRKLKLEGSSSSSDSQRSLTGSQPDDSKGSGSSSGSGSASNTSGSNSSDSSGKGGTVTTRGGGDDGKTDVEHEHDDANEPVLGPFFADLSAGSLSAGIQQLAQESVPTGTFHELKLAIGPVSADQAGTDASLQQMAAQHASLILDGTVDGKPFRFVSGLVAEIQIEGTIVVSADKSNNVTLSIDPSAWFGGAGTARLDPSDAHSRSAIEDNIKNSIRGFEDDDRHGDDDHGDSKGGVDDGSGHH